MLKDISVGKIGIRPGLNPGNGSNLKWNGLNIVTTMVWVWSEWPRNKWSGILEIISWKCSKLFTICVCIAIEKKQGHCRCIAATSRGHMYMNQKVPWRLGDSVDSLLETRTLFSCLQNLHKTFHICYSRFHTFLNNLLHFALEILIAHSNLYITVSPLTSIDFWNDPDEPLHQISWVCAGIMRHGCLLWAINISLWREAPLTP